MKKIIAFAAVLFFSTAAFALKDSGNPQDWYKRAKTDLEDAELLFQSTQHYDQVCFLAQQAIEKSLKGALIAHGIQPDRTHFTSQLAARYAKINPEAKKFVRGLQEVDSLYVPSRYPKPGFIFTKEKAAECLNKAKSMIAIIR